MFHIALRGIIKSENKEIIEKLEDLIKQSGAELEGRFVSYEIGDLIKNE